MYDQAVTRIFRSTAAIRGNDTEVSVWAKRTPREHATPWVRRYEREHPGEMIHIDIKKFGRFDNGSGPRCSERQRKLSAAPVLLGSAEIDFRIF